MITPKYCSKKDMPEDLTDGYYIDSNDEKFYVKNHMYHNDSGPAIIGKDYIEWVINGKRYSDITINRWFEENDLPPWQEWTSEHKILFKLTFG